MKSTKTKFIGFSSAALIAVSALTGAGAAQAADFSVVADKSTNLALTGQVVNVTVANLPASTGVYVRLCAGTLEDATKARPANCAGMADTAWVTTNPAALGQGAKALTGPIALNVPSSFVSGSTTVDCTKVACGIAVRRDHLGGTADYSLDRFIPVTFASAVVAKTGVALAGSKVNFTILNQKGKKVTFVVGYNRFTKVATSDEFTFSAKAPKDKKFSASAYVGGKKLVGASIKK
jgi:hypothetical protein